MKSIISRLLRWVGEDTVKAILRDLIARASDELLEWLDSITSTEKEVRKTK